MNESVSDNPEVINTDPYTEGWLVKVRLSADAPELLDAYAYAKLTQEA